MLLSTGGGILSTIAVRLVRLVRSGGLGFVPFLFPGFVSASEVTDLAPHDGCERESSPGRAYGHYLWRQRLDLRRSDMTFGLGAGVPILRAGPHARTP